MALAGIRRIDQRIEFGLGLSTDEVKVQGCASREPLLGRGRPDGGHEKRAARQAALLPRWCSRIEHAYPTPSVFATCRSFVSGAEGFEPLTSAVQSRHDTLLQISGVCETAASTRIPHTTLFLGFRDIHSGCCTVAAQKGPGAKPIPHPCLPLLLPPRALGLNMRICPASGRIPLA